MQRTSPTLYAAPAMDLMVAGRMALVLTITIARPQVHRPARPDSGNFERRHRE